MERKRLISTMLGLCLVGAAITAGASPNTVQDTHKDKAAAIQTIIFKQLSLTKLNNSYFHPIHALKYGVPIRNPFTTIPPNVSKAMLADGINLAAMSRYRTVYVGGMLAGASARKLINTDPGTVLVIGNGTIAHDPIYSRGPVVILGNANLMGGIYGESLVWYSDQAPYSTSEYSLHIGLPSVIRGSNPNHSFGTSLYSPLEEKAAITALNRKVAQ
jgi:hypothetical protein